MTDSGRPLPTPPRSRFGRDAQEDAGPASGMISDRMALAAAEGRLEEFLQHEIPEGDHARNLAMMMMGMSGMMPMEVPSGPPQAVSPHIPAPPAPDAHTAGAPEVPPEVLAAIQQGDVANLMGLLRAEHAKRTGSDAASDEAPQAPAAASAQAACSISGAVGRSVRRWPRRHRRRDHRRADPHLGRQRRDGRLADAPGGEALRRGVPEDRQALAASATDPADKGHVLGEGVARRGGLQRGTKRGRWRSAATGPRSPHGNGDFLTAPPRAPTPAVP